MILTAMMPWKSQTGQTYMQPVTSTVKGVASQAQANYGNKSQPPADANNQLSGGGNDNNTSGTAGAVVTPPTMICVPGGGCVMMVPLVSSGSTVSAGQTPLLSDSGSTSGAGSSGNSGATPNPGKTTVYVSIAEDGTTQYVGITDDLAARAGAHLREKGIEIEPVTGLQNISRTDARAVEQVLIEYNGLGRNGGLLLNKINSIADSNPIYSASLQRGLDLLKSINFPGFK